MLRMVLLGLLIPLGLGLLAAMELRTPTRSEVAVVQPLAETTVSISDAHGALAKADRLEITAASSETPAQPALVVSFQEVVHSAQTEQAEVAEASDSGGEPNGHP